jgi:hypothetical protein
MVHKIRGQTFIQEFAPGSAMGPAGPPGADGMAFTYSETDEIDTGARWFDGQRVMRKYISIGALPNNTTLVVPIGEMGMTETLSVWGTAFRGDGVRIPLPATAVAGIVPGNVALWFSHDDSIRVVTTTDMSLFTGLLIIEFLKAAV